MPTSTDELVTLVTKAQQATNNLDSELRRVAFERVLDHLLSNSAAADAARPNRQASRDVAGVAKPDADGVLADTQQRIDAIARYFKISPEVVYHIFDTSEEDPKLVLSTKQLAEAKAQATREITLLVGGALTALGLQTTTSQIREVADDYGKLDSPNFMTTLTNLEEISVLGKPRSPNRIIRMKVAGVEAAQAVAGRIVS